MTTEGEARAMELRRRLAEIDEESAFLARLPAVAPAMVATTGGETIYRRILAAIRSRRQPILDELRPDDGLSDALARLDPKGLRERIATLRAKLGWSEEMRRSSAELAGDLTARALELKAQLNWSEEQRAAAAKDLAEVRAEIAEIRARMEAVLGAKNG